MTPMKVEQQPPLVFQEHHHFPLPSRTFTHITYLHPICLRCISTFVALKSELLTMLCYGLNVDWVGPRIPVANEGLVRNPLTKHIYIILVITATGWGPTQNLSQIINHYIILSPLTRVLHTHYKDSFCHQVTPRSQRCTLNSLSCIKSSA